MSCRTGVYYAFCAMEGRTPKEYKRYQREIADKILTYGVKKQFGISFSREFVKLGVHGKPFWNGAKQVCFNVSNTAGMVVCGVSKQELGVDAERIRRVGTPVVRRSCQEPEITYITGQSRENFEERQIDRTRFFQLWTLKESYLKMIGEGLHFPIEKAVFSIGEAEGRISCSQPGFFQQRSFGEYWVSLCTKEASEVLWQELRLEEL